MRRLAISSSRLQALTIALLRVVVGVIFVVHGAVKLSNIEGTARHFDVYGLPMPTASVYLAIAAEFVGGLALLVGLLTRWAALGTACTMVIAIAFVHVGRGLLSRNGGWEFPLTLLCVSLFFVAHGAGALSIDELLKKVRFRARQAPATEPARGT